MAAHIAAPLLDYAYRRRYYFIVADARHASSFCHASRREGAATCAAIDAPRFLHDIFATSLFDIYCQLRL